MILTKINEVHFLVNPLCRVLFSLTTSLSCFWLREQRLEPNNTTTNYIGHVPPFSHLRVLPTRSAERWQQHYYFVPGTDYKLFWNQRTPMLRLRYDTTTLLGTYIHRTGRGKKPKLDYANELYRHKVRRKLN